MAGFRLVTCKGTAAAADAAAAALSEGVPKCPAVEMTRLVKLNSNLSGLLELFLVRNGGFFHPLQMGLYKQNKTKQNELMVEATHKKTPVVLSAVCSWAFSVLDLADVLFSLLT